MPCVVQSFLTPCVFSMYSWGGTLFLFLCRLHFSACPVMIFCWLPPISTIYIIVTWRWLLKDPLTPTSMSTIITAYDMMAFLKRTSGSIQYYLHSQWRIIPLQILQLILPPKPFWSSSSPLITTGTIPNSSPTLVISWTKKDMKRQKKAEKHI